MISTGSVESNLETGLRSPILLDENLRATLTFGVRGTPSAVLVDHDGRIASEVASGGAAVLDLCAGKGAPLMSSLQPPRP